MRLLFLWRRTRALPELLVGIGVLGIGPVGFGVAAVGLELMATSPTVARGLLGLSLVGVCVGSASKFYFNYHVYHAGSTRIRAAVGIVFLVFAGLSVFEGFNDAFARIHAVTLSAGIRQVLQSTCLLWGATEAICYWRMMRRRLRIGLGDPVVTNRFLLWAVGAGAAGLGTMAGVVAQFATGVPSLEIHWVMSSSSALGLIAAVAMGLAFMPPSVYVRWIAAQADGPTSHVARETP